MPQLKLGIVRVIYLRENKHNSLHLVRKYARVFFLGHYLFLEAHSSPRVSFSGNCSLFWTDDVCRQISELIIWLAPWAGKMNQILRCDWLPKRATWSYLARSGLPAVSRKKNFRESHIINPLLIKLAQSRWLDIGLILFFFCEFMDLDSILVHKHVKKKNLANIQPSWPHTWSITHTYFRSKWRLCLQVYVWNFVTNKWST